MTPRHALSITALLLAACGSSGNGSAGSATTGGSGPGTSGGSATSAGHPYGGSVSMVRSGGTGGSFFASAGFASTMATGAPCAGGPQVGSCCYQGPSDGGSSPMVTAESAGTITINDGSSALATLTFSDAGFYSSPGQPTWNSGDSLAVSAAGATVDAFSGSITVPNAVSGLSPALSTTPPVNVPVSSDFVVSWTPDTTSGETLDIALIDGSKGVIHCYSDDSAGSVTVSSTLLSHFSSGDAVTFGVARTAIATPTCANASVQLTAELFNTGQLLLQ